LDSLDAKGALTSTIRSSEVTNHVDPRHNCAEDVRMTFSSVVQQLWSLFSAHSLFGLFKRKALPSRIQLVEHPCLVQPVHSM
jgi:hypothetical protein